ncbi:2-nitropropane dioxygenase [Clostridium zeae]|uniref:Probable nitronate monooxygenase n=1 Tax=Clostridium zeae TaxID=2759022 RepID=A0ABQ1EBI1_9CLOT|nr:nitronate monooxygenase family protein [Clostridium zeae]GFZ32096.1 2-nitropropane dioxygenase [Clostridium zeae]
MGEKINYLKSMPSLVIGDLVAKLPIVQGGMGVGISLSTLASAVAKEGGIGVISAVGTGMEEKDLGTNFLEANRRALRNEIRKAKAQTSGIIGVNIMVALSDYKEIVKVSVEEGVDIIFSGAGLPMELPNLVDKQSKTKLVPIVSSARAASIISRRWIEKYNYVPDAFVVEGPMAGGHLGFKEEQIYDSNYSLEKIVPEVLDEIKKYETKHDVNIPVIVGGGIFSGADINKFIKMGASGVQMGTRFVATYECDASMEFKQSYIDCKEEDIVIIKSPVGLPGRAIRNRFIDDAKNDLKHPFNCPFKCIQTCDYKKSPYCISLALFNAKKGNLKNGFVFAGQNAHKITKLLSVKDLIESLKEEYSIELTGI